MIYIQSNEERTRPHHFDASCAMWGAIETGQKYRLTTFEEVESGKFNMVIPNCLFVGSVEFMREVFSKRGLTDVRLPRNSNRDEEIITLGEALEREKNGEKLFIKSYDIKLFSGTILDGMINSQLTELPKETKVIATKPFDFTISTEWRCYVHNHKLVDCHQYSGEPIETTPTDSYVEDVILLNKTEFPSTYTIDIVISKNWTQYVVEYNDMWAIGNYGVENDIYLRMLKDRYFEIIKS